MSSQKRFTFGGSANKADQIQRDATQQEHDGRKTPDQSAGVRATSGRTSRQGGADGRPNFAYPLRRPQGAGPSIAERKQMYEEQTRESKAGHEASRHEYDQPPPYNDGLSPVSAGLDVSSVGQARTRSPSPHALFPDVPPPETLGTHPSMRSDSDRSIYIGYDPSSPTATRNSTASSNVIPNFSTPNPRLSKVEHSDSRRAGPPPSRWPASSIYSQNVTMVSPIPEESGSSRVPSRDDREYYASGTAVSSNWVAGPADFDEAIDAAMEEWDTYGRAVDDAEETGLVRQASVGRKSKATIVHNVGHSAIRSQTGALNDVRHIVELRDTGNKQPNANAEVSSAASSVVLSGSPKVVHIRGNSSVSSKASSPLSSVKNTAASETLDTDKSIVRKGGYRKKSDTRLSLALAKELGYQGSAESGEQPLESPTDPSISSGRRGFFRSGRLPTRLDLAAVRDAEARGSLTSLPDLIRRATRLAAQLDMGARPASRAWSRGSFMDFRSSRSMRDGESLSDMLSSFPPPIHRHNGRGSRLAWPLQEDDDVELGEKGGNNSEPPPKRRVCGLPLWALVLIGSLIAVAIVAAIVLPISLIKKDHEEYRHWADPEFRAELRAQCQATSTCKNGGLSVANVRDCSCVCINGFTGVNCEIAGPDPACTIANYGEPGFTYDLYKGLENATIGKAVPESLWAADRPAFNLDFDISVLLGEFSRSNVSCTSQNALITFNGHPFIAFRGNYIESSLQWGRYSVLYVAQELGMEAAEKLHTALDDAYTAERWYGDVVAGEVTVHLGKNQITMPGGEVVGSKLQQHKVKREVKRWFRWID